MKFRIGLDHIGQAARPVLERDDLARARAARRAEEVAQEAADLEVLRRKAEVEAPWATAEDYARAHAHSDWKLFEYPLWNAEDGALVDAVLLRVVCRDCFAELDRWVTPPQPVPRSALSEAVERMREALRALETTGRRPAWASREVEAGHRRIDVGAFADRHRVHGPVEATAERFTHPVAVPGGTVDELDGVSLVLRCRCGEALSWWATTEEAAEQILAELRAVAG